MKMKKLSDDHYIVMDDSDIKIGDVVAERLLTGKYELFTIQTLNDIDEQTQIKITHSTQPEFFGTGWMQSIQPLFLSEVKELLGVVDIEKKVLEYNRKKFVSEFNPKKDQFAAGIIVGWKQALEDNKDRKYTEEDMRKAMRFGSMRNKLTISELESSFQQLIQSLQPKTEWNVEIVEDKLKLKL